MTSLRKSLHILILGSSEQTFAELQKKPKKQTKTKTIPACTYLNINKEVVSKMWYKYHTLCGRLTFKPWKLPVRRGHQ